MYSILMVLSSATAWTQKDGSQRPTGFWAEEFVAPYEAFASAGVRTTVVTPHGQAAVVDALSLTSQANQGDEVKVSELATALERHAAVLASPRRIDEIDLADFDAVFVPGGHGPMQDLAVDTNVGQLLSRALANSRQVVAAVCHGSASFLAAGDAAGWAFRGRRMTAFTNAEETQVGLAANAPWLLEDRLRDAGASFDAGAPWGSYVVVDGNLVTGQNPASAAAAAQAVLDLLAARGE